MKRPQTDYRLSRQLSIRQDTKRMYLAHSLSGTVLGITNDILTHLNAFKEPARPDAIPDAAGRLFFQEIIASLAAHNILLGPGQDEELDYLENRYQVRSAEKCTFPNCICFHPGGLTRLASDFCRYLWGLSSGLPGWLKGLGKRDFILYLARREDLFRFWPDRTGPGPHSESICTFVAWRRVLVIDIAYLFRINWLDPHFTSHMVHELVHTLMGNLVDRPPAWLEEGICDYYALGAAADAHKRLFGRRRLLPLDALSNRLVRTFADLEKPMNGICQSARQSHAFVSYLFKNLALHKLVCWLAGQDLGADWHQTFAAAFGRDLYEYEKAWHEEVMSLI